MSEILDFFADNAEVTQAIAKSVPMIMGIHQANKAKNDIEDYQTALNNIEKNRQQIVNPYANVTNPFANMQVATKAAEMQAEQTDIALANTLDTLRETGGGGATALAQAALKSKQDISADIQKQEVENQRLYAQGQQQMEVAKAKGKAFAFQAQEMRDIRDINRLQQNIDIAQQQRAAGISTAALAGASAIAGLSGTINPEVKNTDTSTLATIDYDGDGVNDLFPKRPVENTIDFKTGNVPLFSSTGNAVADRMKASGLFSDAQINDYLSDPNAFTDFNKTEIFGGKNE